MEQLSTTVFTGFLGSGKTTIISDLIDQLQQDGEQVVYIKNEIGAENIDGALMEGKHIKTRELLNGCICCTLVGPFAAAIDEIIATLQPDRLVIEASGAAEPAAIALMIDGHPSLRRDGVITIIDVLNFEGYKDISQTARNQAKFTDLIVFNKVELVELDRKRAVVAYIRELNDEAPIVEAPMGILHRDLAFGVRSADLDCQLLREKKSDQTSEKEEHSSHVVDDGIETITIDLPQAVTEQRLALYLNSLPPAVFRVKGLVRLGDQSFLVNKVGRRSEFTPLANSHVVTTKRHLVLIGFRIQKYKTELMMKG